MQHDFSIKLDPRTASGKQAAKLRQQGLVPSVIYEGQKDTILTQSPAVETTKLVHGAGKHSPVQLILDGKKHLAMIKTIDFDPVKQTVRHVAFHAIKQNDVITAEVPVVLVGAGESPAEKAGLIILQAIEHIEIKAKPADLPESLEVSLEGLATTEDKLTIGDIVLPQGVELADQDPEFKELVIANVYEPAALEAANEAAAGDAEPDEKPEVENGADDTADEQQEKSE